MAALRPMLLLWLALAAASVGSCSRHADLVDDPMGGIELGPMNPYDDSELVDLEVPFDQPPYLTCGERPTGACVGVNDFPCDFGGWLTVASDTCQTETGCRANGWVVADMGPSGCVERLGMTEPNDEFAACLIEVLAAYRCPCGVERRRRFLGIANLPCFPGELVCGPSEFPCPSGQVCEEGHCVPAAN